jgi:CheY-like chemotaxis protein
MGQSNQKKILIADDEASVRSLVKKLLSKNYVVIEASDGEEAVKVAVNQKPDFILMDILMPKMDGLTACYAIKRNQATRQIPVIMLTAVDYELNRKLSQDVMGAQGYITKPFDAQALMATIAKFLDAAK